MCMWHDKKQVCVAFECQSDIPRDYFDNESHSLTKPLFNCCHSNA
jgi:hypothetical protein